MIVSIYVLKDPITNEIRYVGKANNVKNRFYKHIQCSKNDTNLHKKNWINKLRRLGYKPIIEVIDETTMDAWKDLEKFYIRKYLESGHNLLNFTDGGDGLSFSNSTSFKKGNGAKKVVLLNKSGNYINTFESGVDATKFIGKRGLDSVLKGKTKTCGGYICLYEEKYLYLLNNNLIDDFVSNINKNNGINNGIKTRFKPGEKPWNNGIKYKNYKRRKIVYQYNKETKEFIREWNGIVEIAETLNFSYDAINANLLLHNKSSHGYIWSYNKLNNDD